MATSSTKVPSLPPLPTNLDPQLRTYLKQVDTYLRVKTGESGNPKDRNLTLRDLEENGIVSSVGTVNDFSITAGDPTVKFVAPNQLIESQVGKENTLRNLSKTAFALSENYNLVNIGTAQHSGLTTLNFLFGTSGSFGWPNNSMVGSHPNTGAKYQSYLNVSTSTQFSFKTPPHDRGGTKPYLISVTADKVGSYNLNTATQWVTTVTLLDKGNTAHNGNFGLYNQPSVGQNYGATGQGVGVNGDPSQKGEIQLTRYLIAPALVSDFVAHGVNLHWTSELRGEREYVIGIGSATIGVTSPAFANLHYRILGLTT